MSGQWIGMLDKVLNRERLRCPTCGNAVTVSKRKLDNVCECGLCGAVFIPSVYLLREAEEDSATRKTGTES
jgi:ribosomal protein L37AE/L43A